MADGKPLDSLDLSDQETEQKLVTAARNQLAASRQQLLATMVLMGINRIVVTDGKISAKILYDFQAKDNRKLARSATAYDFARDQSGNLQKTASWESQSETSQGGGSAQGSGDGSADGSGGDGDSSYYTKGTYKYAEQPVLTAVSTASDMQDSSLQTKASLAGNVDINFKSDYFPLEKMADSFQIANLQAAAQPGRGAAGARGATQPAAGGTAAATTGAGSPAAGPTAAAPTSAHAGA
jgi:hypothetical protein